MILLRKSGSVRIMSKIISPRENLNSSLGYINEKNVDVFSETQKSHSNRYRKICYTGLNSFSSVENKVFEK